MIFSTYSFIFVFLPIVFFTYRVLTVFKLHTVAKLWLVLASLYFYAQGAGEFMLMFVAAILFNYTIGTSIMHAGGQHAQRTKRLLLTIGLAGNIAFLGYYKYSNILIENINMLTNGNLSFTNIVLPLGISFFTFQFIAYLVDCYKGHIEEYSILNYLLFITFFPQLIVGPIVHHKEMIEQYDNERVTLFNAHNFMLGVFLFSIGCAKKILLADPLTGYAEAFLGNVAGSDMNTAWLAMIAYTFSYYFDLSGYADMAIGLGWMFNIKLPQNFNSPYRARNFRDYWQRWHMTLSRFLSDYIFRSVYRKGKGSFNFYLAVMVTFLVSGFWHGAGWHFVVWGLLNGVFVCTSNYMYRNKLKLPFLVAWVLTFAGVVGTRLLFVSTGFSQSIEIARKMFSFQNAYSVEAFLAYNAYTIALLLVAMAIAFFARNTGQIAENFKPSVKYAVWAALLLVLSLFQMTEVSDFLYFQF